MTDILRGNGVVWQEMVEQDITFSGSQSDYWILDLRMGLTDNYFRIVEFGFELIPCQDRML